MNEHGWFSCRNKGTKKCMPIRRACDGYPDCDDRVDEGGLCSNSTILLSLKLALRSFLFPLKILQAVPM